jgi:hypothetical protein
MATNLFAEDDERLTYVQAARRLPRLREDRPVHPSTIQRWANTGLNGVRLATTFVGGRRVTSVAAIEKFFAEVAEARARKADLVPCAAGSA